MANMFAEIMQGISDRSNMHYGICNDGDYLVEDDGYQILHCKQCGKPKQTIRFISKLSNEDYEEQINTLMIREPSLDYYEAKKRVFSIRPSKDKRIDFGLVGVPCQCQLDVIEGRKRREKEDIRIAIIKQNRLNCFSSSQMAYALKNDVFSKYESNEFIEKSKGYCKTIAKRMQDGKGLILCGNSGGGKTVASICLANQLLDQEFTVKFRMQDEITLQAFEDINKRNQVMNEFIDTSILIIDEFRLNGISDGARDLLMYLISQRINSRKPIVLTTNHTRETFKNAPNDKNKRIFERLNQACYIVENNSHNYRRG